MAIQERKKIGKALSVLGGGVSTALIYFSNGEPNIILWFWSNNNEDDLICFIDTNKYKYSQMVVVDLVFNCKYIYFLTFAIHLKGVVFWWYGSGLSTITITFESQLPPSRRPCTAAVADSTLPLTEIWTGRHLGVYDLRHLEINITM